MPLRSARDSPIKTKWQRWGPQACGIPIDGRSSCFLCRWHSCLERSFCRRHFSTFSVHFPKTFKTASLFTVFDKRVEMERDAVLNVFGKWTEKVLNDVGRKSVPNTSASTKKARRFTVDRNSSKLTFSPCAVLVVAVCYLGHPKNWLIDWLIDWLSL